MLIILFILAFKHTLAGSPLSPSNTTSNNFPTLDLPENNIHFGQRTVQDIVISCFATIFACTWTVIHPNIPAPTDSWGTCFVRRVMIMVYALLTPELITMWALRQRLAAKEIMEEYNKEILGVIDDTQNESCSRGLWMGVVDAVKCILAAIRDLFYHSPLPEKSANGPRWTVTHGFFLQMGGFMLSEDGEPVHTLLDRTQLQHHASSRTLLSAIQEGSVDFLQITVDDIMDRNKADTASKLLVTLQTTWFIVQCIARWSQHLPVTELEIVTLGFAALNGITYTLWWHKPQNVGRPIFLERKRQDMTMMQEIDNAPLLHYTNATKDSWLRRKIRQEIQNRKLWQLPVAIAYRIIQVFFGGLGKLMGNYGDGNDHRVPTFYSARFDGEFSTFRIGVLTIGLIFGSIHLIPGWFLDFASCQEMWLWRVSAIIITAVPIYLAVVAFLANNLNNLIIGILILYPIARIILLVLSLIALHSPPPGTLQTIEWTTYIPHL